MSRSSLRAAAIAGSLAWMPQTAGAMPRFDRILLLVEENQGPDDVIGRPLTPNLTRLAHAYGLATRYYGVVHPSEGNYVAMIGGDDYGIHDDDPYFCGPANPDAACRHSGAGSYPNHTVDAANLATQLVAAGLTWRAYEESIPRPGAADAAYPTPDDPAHRPAALYAAKHDPFMNYRATRGDTARIVGFDALHADLASGHLPSFALIVPNQCDDMHGLGGDGVPADCAKSNETGRIARGDAVAGRLVAEITASPAWHRGRDALVIITDEGGHHAPPAEPVSCCGAEPGGHGLAIVLTNAGPRSVVDPTPYNHYSLLRTIEDAFGLAHLRHANDTARGVVSMEPLFAVAHDAKGAGD